MIIVIAVIAVAVVIVVGVGMYYMGVRSGKTPSSGADVAKSRSSKYGTEIKRIRPKLNFRCCCCVGLCLCCCIRACSCLYCCVVVVSLCMRTWVVVVQKT